MKPVPFWMFSSKVATRLATSSAPVASSAGLGVAIVGAVVSATPVVKFQVAAPAMPAKELLAVSFTAVASIST